jgi:hypothetical protein
LNDASKFATVVVVQDYNHDAIVALSALLHYRIRALTPNKHLKVLEIAQLGYSPAAILAGLKHANKDCCLVP